MDNKVIITKKEYKTLLRNSAWYVSLSAAGVADWSGFPYAKKLYNKIIIKNER